MNRSIKKLSMKLLLLLSISAITQAQPYQFTVEGEIINPKLSCDITPNDIKLATESVDRLKAMPIGGKAAEASERVNVSNCSLGISEGVNSARIIMSIGGDGTPNPLNSDYWATGQDAIGLEIRSLPTGSGYWRIIKPLEKQDLVIQTSSDAPSYTTYYLQSARLVVLSHEGINAAKIHVPVQFNISYK